MAAGDTDIEPPSESEQPRYAAVSDPVVRALVAALCRALEAVRAGRLDLVAELVETVKGAVHVELYHAAERERDSHGGNVIPLERGRRPG